MNLFFSINLIMNKENFDHTFFKITLFFRLGAFTCRRPLPVIIGCFIFTSLGCLGLPFIRMENNAIKLWIPQVCQRDILLSHLFINILQESDFSLNYNWLWANFPPEFRQHSVIIHGDDILTPEAIQKVCKDINYQILKIMSWCVWTMPIRSSFKA